MTTDALRWTCFNLVLQINVYTLTNSTYYNPSPTRQTILENTARFIHAISKNIEQGSLSDGTVRVHFRHDVYRFLFHDKNN